MALVTLPRQYLADANGRPRVGAKAYFYRAGTTTEITVYQDPDFSTAHTNPVESTSDGIFPATYVNPGVNPTYKIVITDADDVAIYTEDDIPAAGAIYPQTTAEANVNVTPSNLSYPPGDIFRNGAASGSNSSIAIQDAIDQAQESTGSAVRIPQGRFILNSTISADGALSIYGQGYYSELELPGGGSAVLPLLIQNTSAAINGVRLRDFRVDGNAGGQLDAGLIQLNNAQGFVVDGVWVENGSRASGASGVNGIAMAAAGSGQAPSGVILSCVLQAQSKAGINISTGCDGVTAAFNRSMSNTGNGTSPGIQLQDSYRGKVIGNTINGNEGHGIVAGDVNVAGPNYHLIALNHTYGNGTGTQEGAGIHILNSTGSETHQRTVVTDNIITDNGDGLTTGGSGVQISSVKSADVRGNYIFDNALHGVWLTAQIGVDSGHIRVVDNTIDANNVKGNASGAGIFVGGVFDHLEICRNKISNSDASDRHEYGIYFADNTVINDLVMKDNFITEMGTAEYFFGAITVNRFDIQVDGVKQTTDATQTTVMAFPIADNTACFVKFAAIGVKSDGSERAVYEYKALVYRDGGSATIQGTTATEVTAIESDSTWGVALNVSGNSFVAQVTGAAATTINWRWKVEAWSI